MENFFSQLPQPSPSCSPQKYTPLGGVSLGHLPQRHLSHQATTIPPLTKDLIKQAFSIGQKSHFKSQVQEIISDFRTAQMGAVRFLEEIRDSRQFEAADCPSFDHLLQIHKEQENRKCQAILAKMQQQFRMKLSQHEQAIKQQNISPIVICTTENYATQTNDDTEQQNALLKRQLQQKETEYDALYEFKKDSLREGEALIRSYQLIIEKNEANIHRMESEIIGKDTQIRNMQAKIKQLQDNLLTQMRMRVRDAIKPPKAEHNKIEEKDKKEINTNITPKIRMGIRKRRYNNRGQSILSVSQPQFGSNQMAVSKSDFAINSLREIAFDFARLAAASQEVTFEDSYSQGRFSRQSIEKKGLFKILQKYMSRVKPKKSSFSKQKFPVQRTQGQPIKTVRQKSSRLMAIIEKEIGIESPIESEIRYKKAEENKIRQIIETGQFESNLMVEIPIQEVKIIRPMKKEISFHVRSQSQALMSQVQPYSKRENSFLLAFPEEVQTKSSIINSNKSQRPPTETRSRLKKGVSFQVQNQSSVKLEIINTLSIVIKPAKAKINNFQQSSARVASPIKTQNRATSLISRSPSPNTKPIQKSIATKKVESVRKVHHSKAKSILDRTAEIYEPEEEPAQRTREKRPTKKHTKKTKSIFEQPRLSHHIQSSEMPLRKFLPEYPEHSIIRPKLQRFSQKDQLNKARQLAAKCENIEQFAVQLQINHQKCGPQCNHIQKYLNLFEKLRQDRRQTFKLGVQNINSHIRQSFPQLPRATMPN